jgi:N-acetylglucosaminyldiphosphoundecaprenol N-acetyl-beta-D-mannosaminyltransferase
MKPQNIQIFDIPLTRLNREQAAMAFIQYAQKKSGAFFAATPNAEILLQSRHNPELKKYLQSCALNFADSVSLLWATEYKSKNWSKPRALIELLALPLRKKYWNTLPEVVCGSDIFEDICALAAQKSLKIFLLGGRKGVAKKTKTRLESKYPKLQIVGTSDADPDQKDLPQNIKSKHPDIIFVAYGCPKQELWIAQNLEKTGARIGLGIGGTFDFVSGSVPRAPQIFRRLGLEWLYRLTIQPSRLSRIWNAVVIFPGKVLTK